MVDSNTPDLRTSGHSGRMAYKLCHSGLPLKLAPTNPTIWRRFKWTGCRSEESAVLGELVEAQHARLRFRTTVISFFTTNVIPFFTNALAVVFLFGFTSAQVLADSPASVLTDRINADNQNLLQMGIQDVAGKNFVGAEQKLQDYSRRCPDDPVGFFWLGKCADEKGNYDGAFHYYANSVMLAKQLGLDSEQLRVNLGNSLSKLNYLDQSIQDYKRALEINDSNVLARVNLSKIFLLQGKYNQALIELGSLEQMGIMQKQPELILLLSLSLKGNNENPQAIEQAKRYMWLTREAGPQNLEKLAEELSVER